VVSQNVYIFVQLFLDALPNAGWETLPCSMEHAYRRFERIHCRVVWNMLTDVSNEFTAVQYGTCLQTFRTNSLPCSMEHAYRRFERIHCRAVWNMLTDVSNEFTAV
jgi:hypothetical protein